MHSELHARIVLPSSICQPMWMSLILFSSCWVFDDVSARCIRMSTRHLLIISVPGFQRHIPCTSLNSSSFPPFHTLCLSDSVFVCINPCRSRQNSLNDRSDSFSGFVIIWFRRSSMRCKRSKRSTTRTTSSATVSLDVSRQNAESSRLNLRSSFNHNSRHWVSRSFFVSFDLLCQLQFQSHHLPRSATQSVPVRRFPSNAQCPSCPTFASRTSILDNGQNCSCSIMKTDKNSLSHATCK